MKFGKPTGAAMTAVVLLVAVLLSGGLTGAQGKPVSKDKKEAVSTASEKSAPASPAPGTAAPGDEAVARIEDQVITRKEWEAGINQALGMLREMIQAGRVPPGAASSGELSEDQRRKLLDGMVSTKVLETLVKKAGIEVSDEQVNQEFQKVKEAQGFKSDEELSKALEASKMTLDDIKARLREKLSGEKYAEATCKDITVSDQEVQAEYDRLKAAGQMELPENLDVASILIRVTGTDEAAWTEAKKKIDAARARIIKGEDFAKVAAEVSEDPLVKQNNGVYQHVTRERGPFGPGAEFSTVAFALPANQVSEPFRTRAGWHIIKVTTKHEPGLVPFDDVKERLKELLLAGKRREAITKVINDAKANMKIEIMLPPAAPVAAPSPAPQGEKKDDAGNSLLLQGST